MPPILDSLAEMSNRSDFAKPAERPSLQQLANQGVEELLTQLGRVLPGTSGQVGVAAFNSSI